MAPSSREGTLWEMSPDSKQQDKKESGRCHKRKGRRQSDHFYLGKARKVARRHRAGPLRVLEVDC